MQNIYTRQAASFRNEMRQSCAALVGIVQGILADGELRDQEIRFLQDWLHGAETVSLLWPGSVIHAQVKEILADGIITREEREHLQDTLLRLIGGSLDQLAESTHVSALPIDEVASIEMPQRNFCFTGDFAFGPRTICESAVSRRGGTVTGSVTKKLHYLVVGGLGSAEWKHGSFGTKIEKAIHYKENGVPLLIVHEDSWAASLARFPAGQTEP
jgi:NAD-dependent DNA ligase